MFLEWNFLAGFFEWQHHEQTRHRHLQRATLCPLLGLDVALRRGAPQAASSLVSSSGEGASTGARGTRRKQANWNGDYGDIGRRLAL